jgi:hypothetical protein
MGGVGMVDRRRWMLRGASGCDAMRSEFSWASELRLKDKAGRLRET